MDEVTRLLDQAATGWLGACDAPPMSVIRQRARRRGLTRTVASVTLVVAMTAGGVIGLAGSGRASESTGHGTLASAEAQAGPAHGAR